MMSTQYVFEDEEIDNINRTDDLNWPSCEIDLIFHLISLISCTKVDGVGAMMRKVFLSPPSLNLSF